MELPISSLATNDKQNVDVFKPHSTKVFNRDDAPVDFTVLDRINHKSIKMHLEITHQHMKKLKSKFKNRQRIKLVANLQLPAEPSKLLELCPIKP
jgi:hypothetical protein